MRGIFDIGWTYHPIDFNQDPEIEIKIYTQDDEFGKSWIETSIEYVYEKRQHFMIENNRRFLNLEKLLN